MRESIEKCLAGPRHVARVTFRDRMAVRVAGLPVRLAGNADGGTCARATIHVPLPVPIMREPGGDIGTQERLAAANAQRCVTGSSSLHGPPMSCPVKCCGGQSRIV